MTPYDYPEDEFDVADDGVPAPVGVHRAQAPVWRSWLPLLLVLVLAPLLAWGAVTLLGRAGSSPAGGSSAPAATAGAVEATDAGGQAAEEAAPATEEPAEPATTEPAAQADYTTGVTVLNGTSTTGLAGRTGDRLTNAGFTAVSVPSGAYSQAAPEVTTVYYASADNAATAQAVADSLGVTNVVESVESAQSNPIVVILRSDFVE